LTQEEALKNSQPSLFPDHSLWSPLEGPERYKAPRPDGIVADATLGMLDGQERYRYDLRRTWGGPGSPLVNFVMLNPSTADASEDDPTVRRCIGFARGWDFGGLAITNLFAWRATDPKGLKAAPDPVGPANDGFIAEWAGKAALVVCAWGAMSPLSSWAVEPPPWDGVTRARRVLEILRGLGVKPKALGLTAAGHPAHPLYLAGATRPFDLEVGVG
jgi:hypothetical protein